MINLYNAQFESLNLHIVKNKSRKETPFLSNEQYRPGDELTPLLKEFFLKPFREKEDLYYQFTHEVELEYNEMYKIAYQFFNMNPAEHPDKATHLSKQIAKHLFEQSNHPHIKDGELYVAFFENVSFENKPTQALGIFKSELKRDFLQVNENGDALDVSLFQGISLETLDKGCLIFNVHEDEGYRIMTVDSNRYDARYWLEHFLGVDAVDDSHSQTRRYLKFCENFAKDVVLPAEDKKEQVMFQNRAVNYFGKNDEFEESEFLNEVIDNPDLIPEFKSYKVDKGEKYNVEDLMAFSISNSAVSEMRKSIKNVITLDTNITIKIDFVNPESAEKFLEKGWDEEKQMYYYLCYFNKEQK